MDDIQTPQPTPPVDQPSALDQMPPNQNQSSIPSKLTATIIISFLLIFPPISWLIMLLDKRYRGWFANQLIIFGLLFGFLTAIFAFLVGPKVIGLYKETGKAGPNIVWFYLLLFFCILQVIFGVYLSKKSKGGNPISKVLASILAGMLLLDLFGFVVISSSFLTTIYNLTSQF